MTTLDELLMLEPDLWKAEVDGIKLWPAIRTAALFEGLHPKRPAPDRQPNQPGALAKQWRKHLKTARWMLSPAPRQRYSAVFFRPANDRYTRPYAAQLPHPLVVETLWYGQANEAEWAAGESLLLEDTYKIWMFARAKLMRLSPEAERTLTEFAAEVETRFGLEGMRERFAAMQRVYLKRCRLTHTLLARRLFPRIESKLAFVHIASYMGIHAPLVRALHLEGFTVAEIQHGNTGLTVPAYNLPAVCLNDAAHPSRLYLPDLYLTFGSYWGEQIRIPAQKLVIGSPPLMEGVQALKKITADPRGILVVSQWTLTQKLVDLTVMLARALHDYHIVYKLHPREVEADAIFDPLRTLSNVTIEYHANVHELIAANDIIVGFNSTVLMETLAFDRKRLFLLTGGETPPGIGSVFSDDKDLLRLIRDPKAGYPSRDRRDFWAANPQANIADFLSIYTQTTS